MVKENVSQEFKIKYIDETKNYFTEEINQNKLMRKKHKKVCMTLNYNEHFLILVPAITGYILISAFVSIVGISMGITSSAVELKSYEITGGIKKSIIQYKSIIKKKRRKRQNIIVNDLITNLNF